jgi:voltage-gated potassium channel
MIMGYGIIAVPTGIVTAQLVSSVRSEYSPTQSQDGPACPVCDRRGHDGDAQHCKWCGMELSGK